METKNCIICGCELADDSSQVCAVCREGTPHVRSPLIVSAFLIAIVLIAVYSLTFYPDALRNYHDYKIAKQAMNDKRYYNAVLSYTRLSEQYNNKKLNLALFEAQMRQQMFDAAVETLNTKLVNYGYYETAYNYVNQAAKKLRKLSETTTAVSAELKGVTDPAEARSRMMCFDTLNFDAAYVTSLQGVFQNTPEKSEELLVKAYELDPDYTFILARIGNVQRTQGRVEDALQTYEMALAINKTDAEALRGKAVLCLLEGNFEAGLLLAQQAYAITPRDQNMPETVVIALTESNRDDDAAAFLEENEAAGYVFSSDLKQYLNGSVSLRDYYIPQRS